MTKITWKKLKDEFKFRKKGLIIGAITGAVAAYVTIQQGADLSTITEAGKGLLDSALGRSTPVTKIAAYKLYGVFISLGAALGAIADKIISKR